jgi:parallel beta-helix repeat protein
MYDVPVPGESGAVGSSLGAEDVFSQRRAMLAGLGGLAAGAFMAGGAHAGPLNPPPGPIQSTPGPEPRIPINQQNTPGTLSSTFRIAEPGSYYLTGNVVGEAGKNGIEIDSDNVVLDLMGYALRGLPSAEFGIAMPSFRKSVVIRNGTISGWQAGGILARIDIGSIEHVFINDNAGWGIQNGGGFGVLIRGCGAIDNGTTGSNSGGILGSENSIVEHCHARGNNGPGIRVDEGSIVRGCTVRSSNGPGIDATRGCSITDNVCARNTEQGISVDYGCFVARNTCYANQSQSSSQGILASLNANRIEDNTCVDNSVGIRIVGAGNIFRRNTCSGNGTNWDVAPNNYGQARLALNTPTGITGNAGGLPLGSEDPHINFTY